MGLGEHAEGELLHVTGGDLLRRSDPVAMRSRVGDTLPTAAARSAQGVFAGCSCPSWPDMLKAVALRSRPITLRSHVHSIVHSTKPTARLSDTMPRTPRYAFGCTGSSADTPGECNGGQ